jgi:hypothetical protein
VLLAVTEEVLEKDRRREVELVESSTTPPGSADPSKPEPAETDSVGVGVKGVSEGAGIVTVALASRGGVAGGGGVEIAKTVAMFRT